MIVVGIDGEAESDAALRWACEEAVLRRVDLRVVHVVSVPWNLPDPTIVRPESAPERKGAQVLERALDRGPRIEGRVEGLLLAGDPASLLLTQAEEAELLVIGSRHRLLGSVSTRVIRHSPCPVVVVRPRRTP
jgi:nucleotide-binding universal stress UspA family protein